MTQDMRMVMGLSVRPFVIVAVISCAAVFIGIIVAYASNPKSRHTGKPLEKYRNLSSQPGYRETVYVDTDNKKYFIQVFETPGP